MGYDVHITRAESWAENEGHWIAAEEWLRVVEEDEELRLDPHPSNGPYMALWNGPSEGPEPWFNWSDGNVYTKNPDAPLLAKMIELAEKLNAKVQGDDGEVYGGGTSSEISWTEPPGSHRLRQSSYLALWDYLSHWKLVSRILAFLVIISAVGITPVAWLFYHYAQWEGVVTAGKVFAGVWLFLVIGFWLSILVTGHFAYFVQCIPWRFKVTINQGGMFVTYPYPEKYTRDDMIGWDIQTENVPFPVLRIQLARKYPKMYRITDRVGIPPEVDLAVLRSIAGTWLERHDGRNTQEGGGNKPEMAMPRSSYNWRSLAAFIGNIVFIAVMLFLLMAVAILVFFLSPWGEWLWNSHEQWTDDERAMFFNLLFVPVILVTGVIFYLCRRFRRRRGWRAFRRGDYATALKIGSRALNEMPGNFDAAYLLASIKSLPMPESYDANAAMALMADSVKACPTDEKRWLALAEVQTSCGEYAAAAVTYRKTLERWPQSSGALAGLALLRGHPGR